MPIETSERQLAVDRRAELERLMRATVDDHTHWIYSYYRPLPVPVSWRPGQTVHADCSKGVQYLCRWADLPDPMDSGYGTWGNSATLWLKLQHLDHASDLLVGDVVTFGVAGRDHAAMVLEPGSDPLLWSDGHQGAPNTYRLSEDHRPAQFLRNPIPAYVPTPEDRLRARTGWFAWVAWRLGEGDWKTYGKRTKRVRPDVPRLIPPAWWSRYAAFMAGRRKGNKPLTGL